MTAASWQERRTERQAADLARKEAPKIQKKERA